MAIYYCLVANRHCPLAEFNNGGNEKMGEIAMKLLKKLDFDQNSVEAVDFEGKNYSYRIDDEVVYVCVTDENFGNSAAALFLKHINQLFDAQFGNRGKATKLKLDLNRDFAPVLKKQMEIYSSESGGELLRELKDDLSNVAKNMQNNIHKIMDRGDKIDVLVDKSDTLNARSSDFAHSSRQLRRKMWMENMKMTIATIVIAILLLVVVLIVWKKHSKKE